jgi:hypothetical protein
MTVNLKAEKWILKAQKQNVYPAQIPVFIFNPLQGGFYLVLTSVLLKLNYYLK